VVEEEDEAVTKAAVAVEAVAEVVTKASLMGIKVAEGTKVVETTATEEDTEAEVVVVEEIEAAVEVEAVEAAAEAVMKAEKVSELEIERVQGLRLRLFTVWLIGSTVNTFLTCSACTEMLTRSSL